MPAFDPPTMDDDERLRRQAFLGIGEQDRDNVRALRAGFARHARAFAEQFYQHLLAHPETAALLRDPEQLERLKALQTQYFSQLLEGVFDAAYFEGRLRVGQTHQRVRLEPAWYLGAYNQYIQITFPLLARELGGDAERVLPVLLSLVKVIFLDIGLALETYFREATEQLRRRHDELQQALGLYWQAQRREEQLRRLASHEVRGGLAAVITSLEDLLDSAGPGLDPAIAEPLQSAARRCWSLSDLLREMLAPAQAAGPTWVETAQVLAAVAGRIGLYAAGRAVQLVLPEAPPRVWADPVELREVFANLVANAVHYLDKEPGRVEISCVPDGEFYAFCVADNGPGIPAELQPRLFEPFVRGPHRGEWGGQAPPTSHREGRRPGGSGLGLYFVRTVVEQGGGRAWVESAPGQGSRFWFTVRRQPPAAGGPARS